VHFPTLPLAILLACLTIQDPPQGPERLQAGKHPTCLRFYSFEGDVKPELLQKELDALATKDDKARIAAGPLKAVAKPKARFLALEVPTKTPAKDVEAALKKICPHAEELAWTAFQGKSRTLPSILGQAPLDLVIGMDNDLRWFDLTEGRARFFFSPGKFDAKGLRAKFGKLFQPFDAGELGVLVRDAIEWRLVAPVDAAAAKAAEKSIAKIPGVKKARIDVGSRTVTAEIEHDGLRGSTPPAGKDSPPEKALAAAGFLVDDVVDALEAAKLGLAEAGAAPRVDGKH
jgi:hypothetical protein